MRFFSRSIRMAAREWFRSTDSPTENAPGVTRRWWDATETNRLNYEHWSRANVTDTPISNDQATQLETIRVRAQYEIANNSLLAGVIETWVADMLMKAGPKLRCTSKSNPEYAEKRQRIWEQWWERPDLRGRQSGVDMLRTAFRAYWSAGEYLFQVVTDSRSAIRIDGRRFETRIVGIAPRRLKDPWGGASSRREDRVVLGVKIDEHGRPMQYLIQDEDAFGAYSFGTGKFSRIDASNILHDFVVLEPDQVRGVPWLAYNLGTIAEMRDYDQQVLDAARQCASQTAYLHSDHPMLDPIQIEGGGTQGIERNTMTILPPGWKPSFLPASQPANNYKEYRHERARELGRLVGMPLLHIMLDARDHNFATARLDRQMYRNQLISHQDRIELSTLDPLQETVAREARLLGALGEEPDDFYHEWIWPALPEGDAKLQAQAATECIDNMTMSRTEIINQRGRDPEDVFKEIAEEKRLIERLGASAIQTPKEELDQMREKADNFFVPIESVIDRYAPELAEADKAALAETWRTKNEPEQSSIFDYHLVNGIVTINEVRDRLGLPAVSWGNEPLSIDAGNTEGEPDEA